MSIRVPDAKVQPHLVYSGNEESSDDEEPLPKQSWRAERFHMEEFLREMRVCKTTYFLKCSTGVIVY